MKKKLMYKNTLHEREVDSYDRDLYTYIETVSEPTVDNYTGLSVVPEDHITGVQNITGNEYLGRFDGLTDSIKVVLGDIIEQYFIKRLNNKVQGLSKTLNSLEKPNPIDIQVLGEGSLGLTGTVSIIIRPRLYELLSELQDSKPFLPGKLREDLFKEFKNSFRGRLNKEGNYQIKRIDLTGFKEELLSSPKKDTKIEIEYRIFSDTPEKTGSDFNFSEELDGYSTYSAKSDYERTLQAEVEDYIENLFRFDIQGKDITKVEFVHSVGNKVSALIEPVVEVILKNFPKLYKNQVQVFVGYGTGLKTYENYKEYIKISEYIKDGADVENSNHYKKFYKIVQNLTDKFGTKTISEITAENPRRRMTENTDSIEDSKYTFNGVVEKDKTVFWRYEMDPNYVLDVGQFKSEMEHVYGKEKDLRKTLTYIQESDSKLKTYEEDIREIFEKNIAKRTGTGRTEVWNFEVKKLDPLHVLTSKRNADKVPGKYVQRSTTTFNVPEKLKSTDIGELHGIEFVEGKTGKDLEIIIRNVNLFQTLKTKLRNITDESASEKLKVALNLYEFTPEKSWCRIDVKKSLTVPNLSGKSKDPYTVIVHATPETMFGTYKLAKNKDNGRYNLVTKATKGEIRNKFFEEDKFSIEFLYMKAGTSEVSLHKNQRDDMMNSTPIMLVSETDEEEFQVYRCDREIKRLGDGKFFKRTGKSAGYLSVRSRKGPASIPLKPVDGGDNWTLTVVAGGDITLTPSTKPRSTSPSKSNSPKLSFYKEFMEFLKVDEDLYKSYFKHIRDGKQFRATSKGWLNIISEYLGDGGVTRFLNQYKSILDPKFKNSKESVQDLEKFVGAGKSKMNVLTGDGVSEDEVVRGLNNFLLKLSTIKKQDTKITPDQVKHIMRGAGQESYIKVVEKTLSRFPVNRDIKLIDLLNFWYGLVHKYYDPNLKEDIVKTLLDTCTSVIANLSTDKTKSLAEKTQGFGKLYTALLGNKINLEKEYFPQDDESKTLEIFQKHLEKLVKDLTNLL